MIKRWISLLPGALGVFVLALSCGSSDGEGTGGASGVGNAGTGGGSGSSGTAGAIVHAGGGGESGTQQGAGAGAGAAGSSAGSDTAAAGDGSGGAGSDAGGAGGVADTPIDTSPLSPAAVPDLAFWLDGTSQSFSDFDENFPNAPDSGRVRSIAEAAPLTGHWQAPTSLERPVREVGALRLKPVESITGYFLRHTAGTVQTDDLTLAISLRPLNSNSAQGAITGQIGSSPQSTGIFFSGNIVGLYFNHSQIYLKKRISRGVHATIIVRFRATRIDVDYEINGLRTTETVETTIDHETASRWILGYDSNLNSGIYGFVSQVVGINRAISSTEASRLMTWLSAQPIPDAYPVSQPLVAILGDSIANGDQVAGWRSWGFSMLSNLSVTNPDVQLLNAASNGAGIPKVKNSDYTDFVLPWYSASRAKNILIVAAGSNDLLGTPVSDVLDRYYGLLDAARTAGWKTVASTVLPRSDASATSSGFEVARTTFNADLVAHWASHADALANVAGITGMGAAGDSNTTTYYTVDKIHPNAQGHALLEPVYRAAVVSQL